MYHDPCSLFELLTAVLDLFVVKYEKDTFVNLRENFFFFIILLSIAIFTKNKTPIDDIFFENSQNMFADAGFHEANLS